MTIKRITVEFVGSDGAVLSQATGSVDRRMELIREARADLEAYCRTVRSEGDTRGAQDHEMVIREAPDAVAWSPKR